MGADREFLLNLLYYHPSPEFFGNHANFPFTNRIKYLSFTHQEIHIGVVESDIRVINKGIQQLNRRIDLILEQQDTLGMMRLSDRSLASFLSEEPDIYTIADCKVVYG